MGFIYIYIYTHIHENRSIPVLSIPFQRVFVSMYVRTHACKYVCLIGANIPKCHASTLSVLRSSLTQAGADLILHVWIFKKPTHNK